MADFDTARMLGLVGGVLVLLTFLFSFFIGFLGFFLQLIGLILVLVSLYMFSNIYGERIIFRDALLSVLIGYGVLFLLLLILTGFAIIVPLEPILSGRMEDLFAPPAIRFMVAWVLLFIVIILGALVVSAFLWYRALNTLSLKSGEGLFRWAGILYLTSILSVTLGVLTLIILIGVPLLLIGVLLDLASWVVLAIAFYVVKPPQPTSTPAV